MSYQPNVNETSTQNDDTDLKQDKDPEKLYLLNLTN